MTEERTFLPLTHAQRRIWYIEELYPGTCVHNIGGLIRIQGPIHPGYLEQAISAFLVQNAALRFQLTKVAGEVRQFFCADELAPLRLLDFRSEADPEQACQAWIQQEFTTPFPLLEHPLYEFALVRIDEETSGYFMKLQHIMADGWTTQLITEQISAFCEQLLSGQTPEVRSNDDYVEYIQEEQHYLQSARFHKDQRFWQETFAAFPETFLAQSSSDLAASRRFFALDAGRTSALRRLARQKKWSLNTFFVSALLLYFQKVQQQDEMIIGIPVFNRRGAKEKKLAGMLTSHMPFRMRIPPQETLAAFQGAVNQNLLRCFFHQKYPYDLLIQDLERGRERIDRLFQVCVNYYNTKPPTILADYPLVTQEWFSGLQMYALQLVIKDWLEEGTLQFMLDYKQHDYTEKQIEHLFAWLVHFVDITLAEQEMSLAEIDLLLEEEREAIIYQRNRTEAIYPDSRLVQSLFEDQVKATPAGLALIHQDQRMTYAELNARANQLARVLRQAGVRENVVVGIMAQHSFALVVGIWGILKAGGAYLPLDPTYPAERLKHIILESGAAFLLTDQPVQPDVHFAGTTLDLSAPELYQGDATNVPVINQANDLAYLIYTSGSTGQPKGILIEHRSLINYIWWARKTYLNSVAESFAFYSSLAFDLTVTSLFTPLIQGSHLIIYGESGEEFVLARILRENLCTIIKATPAHLALLDTGTVVGSRLRCLIVGGEELRTQLASQIWQKFGGAVRLFNEYGPTEATVGCMVYEYDCARDTDVSVPIGHPIDNTRTYLLTRAMQPVPDGSVAEIYVAGDGIARGYHKRDDLTAERFVTDPFFPASRMYKTGDLGRYRNGAIEYLGRVDQQVKIQGYRIELTEIESALLKHPAIKQAVVEVKNLPDGQKYLVAFVQVHTPLTSIEIKRFLARSLPSFMLPTQVIEQEDFPLSPNGKVDREALARLVVSEVVQRSSSVNLAIEQQLISAVKEVFPAEEVTAESNLYFLGSDSIKAIQLASRLKALGYQVRPADILTYPVLGELALVLETQGSAPMHASKPCEGLVTRTPIAQWFLEQAFSAPDFWHQSILLEMSGQSSEEALHQALRRLVAHHDTLRLNYDANVQSFFYNSAYLVEDLQILEVVELADQRPEAFRQLCQSFKARLRLAHGLLFRALLIHTAGRGDRLLLVAHHMLVDGVSWRILLEDLEALLRAGRRGESLRLPEQTTSVQAWAEALQGYARRIDEQERTYWQQIGSERTHIPADFAAGRDEQEQPGRYVIELSVSESKRLLTEANQRYGTQTHDLLLTALTLALTQALSSRELVLEIEAHGREALFEHLDISRTVGWFTALYPLRFRVESTAPTDAILALKEQLRRVPKKGIGFGVLAYLARAIEPSGRPGIRWNYLGEIDNGQSGEVFTLSLAETGPDTGPVNHRTCELDILALVHEQKLRVAFLYSQSRYREATIQRIADSFLWHLQAIIVECCQAGQSMARLETTASLTEEELQLLLED